MATAAVNLEDLVARLADRRPGRTEANVQSELHMLLVVAPLQLADTDVRDITLEQPAGQRRRIDVEAGRTVFEVKRDLRVGSVRADAEEQLAGYVADRSHEMQQRYVGVLTDGAEWHLYHLIEGTLRPVSSMVVTTVTPEVVDELVVWLESVLATVDRITPTPAEIERRLGAESPAHALDASELAAIYETYRDHPSVVLKRELWAKLLTVALGTHFDDQDSLFIEHTLLVTSAEIIGHAIVGFDPADPSISPVTLANGLLFAQSQIWNVADADFFDWVVEVPEGQVFVKTLARRLARFAWDQVEHDVMKVLYESVIDAEQRKSLGEYYTPDWLANAMIRDIVDDPLSMRVLDPACGSGTFLFHAVRRYLGAATAAGHFNEDAILGAVSHVTGVDVHPVAVTLARVTYLLAIGYDRLRASDRPPFSVPVYLGDSLQWSQQRTLLSAHALTVPTTDDLSLFPEQLEFPHRVLENAGRFDQLVSELANKAADRRPGTPVPSLAAIFRRFAVHPDDQAMVERTFQLMCELHDNGKDHIWGYYIRNLARPVWLAEPGNRVEVLVGNPPWLAFRFMTPGMQASFRDLTSERSLWHGAAVATQQDLSALFVARAIELYLRPGGRFAFVMPLAVLSRRQYEGFRQGDFSNPQESVTVEFILPWNLDAVEPDIFPVPACVVRGNRTGSSINPIPTTTLVFTGNLPGVNVDLQTAEPLLTVTEVDAAVGAWLGQSPYADRFAAGATIFPQVLVLVEPGPTPPIGTGAGRRAIRSRRAPQEKRPWKDLPSLDGFVETQFVRRVYFGHSILPFRLRDPVEAVIPWDGTQLLDGSDSRIDNYPGLAEWWRHAEDLYVGNRASDRLTLTERIDYQRGLRQQFPLAEHRVVYTASGSRLAAARLRDFSGVVEHKLYWAAAHDASEALYLAAILNSDALTELVRPLQSRGLFGPRDFDKYVFQIAIPAFDSTSPNHRRLVDCAERAEILAAGVTLDPQRGFQWQRGRIREELEAAGISQEIDRLVREILGAAPPPSPASVP